MYMFVCKCVGKYFMFLWIYKISFMSLAVAFPVYRLAQQRLPQNFFHLRLLPAMRPLLPCDLPLFLHSHGMASPASLGQLCQTICMEFTISVDEVSRPSRSRWLTMAA